MYIPADLEGEEREENEDQRGGEEGLVEEDARVVLCFITEDN